jgi:hypothetical protein
VFQAFDELGGRGLAAPPQLPPMRPTRFLAIRL